MRSSIKRAAPPVLLGIGLAFGVAAMPAAHAAVITTDTNTIGSAGEFASTDGQTHFRFVNEKVTVSSRATLSPGVALCNPATDFAAVVAENGGTVTYTYGTVTSAMGGTTDPCEYPAFSGSAHTGTLASGLTAGQHVSLQAFYEPNSGVNFHKLSLGAIFFSGGIRENPQKWTFFSTQQLFTELGTGAADSNPVSKLIGTSPLTSVMDATDADTTCYSCATTVPISNIVGLHPISHPLGGLHQVVSNVVTGANEQIVTPNNSLVGANFSVYEYTP
jgi:hypothetical protein